MRRLLASTALVLMAASPLVAQQATDAGPAKRAAAPAGELFLPSIPDALYASELIGMDVYSSAIDYAAEYGDDRTVGPDVRSQWDDIGEINDIVLSPTGDVEGVLVDIGGFLGLGVRTVALDMAQIHVLRDEADESFAAVTSSREELQAAPEFRRETDQTADVAEPEVAEATGDAVAPARAARPTFEREGFTTAEYDELTADNLKDAPVYDATDENIGRVEELILTQEGEIEQAVVDVGGFLGMGVHRIGLAFDEMQVLTNADNSEVRVYIDQTRQTLEQRPEYQE
jgi:hypothetical protein